MVEFVAIFIIPTGIFRYIIVKAWNFALQFNRSVSLQTEMNDLVMNKTKIDESIFRRKVRYIRSELEYIQEEDNRERTRCI